MAVITKPGRSNPEEFCAAVNFVASPPLGDSGAVFCLSVLKCQHPCAI